MTSLPTDPITEIVANAIKLFENYTAYIQAGFSEFQAMQLICCMITMKETTPSADE